MNIVSNIYWLEIYYEDKNESKIRPVLVVAYEKDCNILTITEITSSPPNNPPMYFDQFKEPIYKWKDAGLSRLSYVKTHKLHRIDRDEIGSFCGELDIDEFLRILDRIIEVNH
ncbi:MAG: type II toxin-antitoxin system PemK/MazF family toxin [Eubacteriales bacterium]